MKIYRSVSDLVGRTPLVEAENYCNKNSLCVKIYAKLEGMNPAGSAKDRVALYMIDGAEKRGELSSGATIIEPTSGNTGIGLCAVGVSRGYSVIIVMPDNMSKERIALMRAYGARVVLTDGSLGMKGAIAEAERLRGITPNSYIPAQFDNPDNPYAHYITTGPEIWEDTDGDIDIFVSGVGTGGTVSGVGKYLKEKKNGIKIVAVEPESSPYLSRGISGSHGLMGIGAGFVPSVLDTEIYGEIITVTEADAYREGREFASCEGILVGISSGAVLYAARLLAQREENFGKKIAVLLPDSGERYLSTDMYKEQE